VEEVLAMGITTYGSLTESYISADRSGWDGEQDFFINGEHQESGVEKEEHKEETKDEDADEE
jgi:cleavage and polyadenylation specificity factor subunit 3